MGKILENIVKEGVVKHLNKFQLIRPNQHGFTSGKSCLQVELAGVPRTSY